MICNRRPCEFLCVVLVFGLVSCARQRAPEVESRPPAAPASAEPRPKEAPERKPVERTKDPYCETVVEAMLKAGRYMHSISTHGGYLWYYTSDLTKRWGEGKATPTQIWVQMPGTPAVGRTLLRAYQATGRKEFLDWAKEAGYALAWGQLPCGGWYYSIDFKAFDPAKPEPPRLEVLNKLGKSPDVLKDAYAKMRSGTFDDNNTQGALRFLMALDQVLDEPWLDRAVQDALAYVLKAQFPNGAWPQVYPLRSGYSTYYTFNDNSINDCIYTLLDAHRYYGKPEYLDAAKKGGDFIILSQCNSPQTGWAQQYGEDLKPAWARAFEPPAICSAVTSRNIRTLVELYVYTGEERYLKPIPAAIDWLKRSKIAPDTWARFYELETNRPVYCDRGRRIVYNVEELGHERRHGYSWQSSYGVSAVIGLYEKVKGMGAEACRAERSKQPSAEQRRENADRMRAGVEKIVAAMDEQGRWLNKDYVKCATFNQNMASLCAYVETAR